MLSAAAAITGAGIASVRHDSPAQLLDLERPPRDDPAGWLRRELGRGFRYKDRATQLGVLAAVRALAPHRTGDPATTGVVVSSNFGNLQTVCDVAGTIRAEGVAATSPMDLPNASSNVIASTIAIHLGLRGPNLTVCNGAPSGLDAVRWAAGLIRAGRAERVVVVGVEPATEAAAALQGRGTGELFEGAAAVLVERCGRAAAALRIERGARGADERDAAARAATGRVALYLGGRSAPDAIDVERVLGRTGGALGVLQCALATTRLDAPGSSAIAVAGNDIEGATALLLTREEG